MLPVPGRLLVEAPPFGAAIIEHDGRIRRLGDWYDAAWSPDGERVAATNGRMLAVIGDTGRVQWRYRRAPSAPPTQPDWTPDGKQVAYRSGRWLRIIGADGRHDHAIAGGLRFAGPRWRPDESGELAWADLHGVVAVLDAATAHRVWRSPPGPPVRPDGLQWSRDGRTLAAISGSVVRIFDAHHGRLLRRLTTSPHSHFQFGSFAGDRRLILVRHDFTRGHSRITRARARNPRARERTILAGRGSVFDATPSPDRRWLLVGRRSRDQWQLLPLAGGHSRRIRGVTRRLNPRATGVWAFPAVRGWNAQRP